MACEPPEQRRVPLSRWSSAELAGQAVREGLVAAISSSTVRRWLHADAIKPWRYRSWIFPRDPDFAVKAARVLDLYARVSGGVPLGADDYVISADEKSQLQALRRCHPSRSAGPGHVAQVEFEYERGGTLAYMGAYDVHRARLIGTVADKTGIVPFMDLVAKVMTTEPYASPGGCTGSSTTGRPTTGNDPSTGCARRGRQPGSCICRSTPRGSTRSRSCSPSSSARSSSPPTSPISTRSLTGSAVSRTATTRPRPGSTGGSPRPISRRCSSGSIPDRTPSTARRLTPGGQDGC